MGKLCILQSILLAYPPQPYPTPAPAPAPGPQYQQQPPPQYQPPPPQQAPPPAAAPPPKKAGKPWLLPFVFAIIAVVFILLSVIGPWQTYTRDVEAGDEEISYQYDLGLQSYTLTASEDVLYEPGDDPFEDDPTDQVTYNYNDKGEDGGMNDDVEDNGNPAQLAAWNTCFYLTLLTFIMAILMLVFILMTGTKRNAKMGKLAMIFAILALVFGLLTPIYAVVGIPAGRQADYDELDLEEDLEHNSWWDSWDEDDEYSKEEHNVGAGWGWYLCLIGGIMALLALLFIMKMNKGLKADQSAAAPPQSPAPAPAPAPAPQYQQPPPQYQQQPPPQYQQPPPQYQQPPPQQPQY